MNTFAICLSFLATGTAAAFAGPVEERQAAMKERAGLLRQLSPMAKGQEEFDAAKALRLLKSLDENAKEYSAAELFPEGSGPQSPDEDNEASPKIWEDWPGFEAAWDKYAATTTAAVAANPQDVAALQAQFGAIGAQCGACHQVYRLSKN